MGKGITNRIHVEYLVCKIKEKAVAFATANYYIHINYISQYNL